MADLECLGRRWPFLSIGLCFGFLATVCLAESVALVPHFQIVRPSAAGEKSLKCTAVPIGDGSILVTVYSEGTAQQGLKLQIENHQIPVKSIKRDPVSRIEFIQIEKEIATQSVAWRNAVNEDGRMALVAMTLTGGANCRSTGWVKQMGGKILPFALLKVVFNGKTPVKGTPLVDENGKVAAIFFQESGVTQTGYAIPAEAVLRVQRDISSGGQLVRGWLGLALRAENPLPQVVRILPNSPASTAGIQIGDMITVIGNRKIVDYADAANAFFYLIPGQPVAVQLVRGDVFLEISVTPTKPRLD